MTPPASIDSLAQHLRSLDDALIAYSGGVDSTLLVAVAGIAGIRFLAVTGDSETMPRPDLSTALEIAARYRLPHRVIRSGEMDDERFVSNPPDRCFYCKDGLFGMLRGIARDEGYRYILDGSNADDRHDHRPGLRARERHGVLSPLMDLVIGKEEVRRLSRDLGLPTWDRPSSPCLSSRFPYGERITVRGLRMVGAAEERLRALGFSLVRVRTAGSTGVIEVGAGELDRFSDAALRGLVIGALRESGLETVLLDREGYRSGKLNLPGYALDTDRFIRLDAGDGFRLS